MNKIKYQSIGELELLFHQIDVKHQLDSIFYEQTYLISDLSFRELDFIELDFEPYIGISKAVESACFGVWKSKRRVYLGHINNAGHGARYMVRPITLAHLKDIQLMEALESNYCALLELEATRGIPYKL